MNSPQDKELSVTSGTKVTQSGTPDVNFGTVPTIPGRLTTLIGGQQARQWRRLPTSWYPQICERGFEIKPPWVR